MQLQAAYHFRDAARTSADPPAPSRASHRSEDLCLLVCPPPVSGVGKAIVAKTALNPVTPARRHDGCIPSPVVFCTQPSLA